LNDPLPWPHRLRAYLDRVAEALAPAIEVARQYYGGLVGIADVFRALLPLGPRGWAISTYGMMIAPEAHRDAADAMADPDGAEAHLEDGWSQADAHRAVLDLVPYVYPPEQRALAVRRQELLARASENFQSGRYEEAVLLIYSQLDGIFQDAASQLGKQGFRRLFESGGAAREFAKLVDQAEVMSGTEEEFFLLVRHAMSKPVKTTTLADHASRHGVLHGRVLGYGTKRRAAQSFAFLAAALEILIALHEEVPMTDEEAETVPIEDVPAGLQFILLAMAVSPVRGIYLANRDSGKDLLLAAEQKANGVDEPPSP
jgi:hypothetical protein